MSHNLGQLIFAAFVVKEYRIAYYLPALIISGLITGIIIGITVQIMISRIDKNITQL